MCPTFKVFPEMLPGTARRPGELMFYCGNRGVWVISHLKGKKISHQYFYQYSMLEQKLSRPNYTSYRKFILMGHGQIFTIFANMTTDCSLNYKFNIWKFQAQTWREHVVYRNCFWHSEQFSYTTCSPHVLQKEELLTKIYL